MRIFVTGSSGFIGTPLCRLLMETGCELVGIDVKPPKMGEYRHETIDIRDRTTLHSLVVETRPEIVVHLAALHYIPYCNEHPNETVATNVVGTSHLLNACQEIPLKRFFFASTAAVYGPSAIAHSEESEVGPVDIYGLTKAYAEELVRRFGERTGIDTVTGRLFNVYGEGDPHPHVIPDLIAQLRRQSADKGLVVKLGNLTPARDYVHVSDAVRAIHLLAVGPRATGRIYNVGTGTAVSVSDLVDRVQEILDEPVKIEQSEARKREVDRPLLLSDARRLHSLGWDSQVTLQEGLRQLLRNP